MPPTRTSSRQSRLQMRMRAAEAGVPYIPGGDGEERCAHGGSA